MERLTSKQQRFVAEYLIDLNATQAAARAGYKDPNKGRQLVTKSNVSEAIREAQRDLEIRTQITQDRVLRELAKVGFGDMRSVMEWGPQGVRLRSSGDISDDAAALVAEVSETTTESGGSIRLKTNDKLRALELIGRHLGMFVDKKEISGALTLTDIKTHVDKNRAILDLEEQSPEPDEEAAVSDGEYFSDDYSPEEDGER